MNGTVSDFLTFLIVGAVVVGVADALIHRVRGPRYRGRTYDPQRPVIQRAGAIRVGLTGKACHFCGAVTFGYSDRCGRCHRLPVRLPIIATESSSPSFLIEAAEPEVTGVGAPARRSIR